MEIAAAVTALVVSLVSAWAQWKRTPSEARKARVDADVAEDSNLREWVKLRIADAEALVVAATDARDKARADAIIAHDEATRAKGEADRAMRDRLECLAKLDRLVREVEALKSYIRLNNLDLPDWDDYPPGTPQGF